MNIKQKAVNIIADEVRKKAAILSSWTGALEAVEALAAAGLLRSGREQEVMCRLTTTAIGSDLMGQRLGVRSDFVTPAMERAVEACKAYCVYCDGHGYGREDMAAKNRMCFDSGSALLAEEAERAAVEPEARGPRYSITNTMRTDRPYAIVDTRPIRGVGVATCDTLEDAERVASAMNNWDAAIVDVGLPGEAAR